jgi:hypothetical protein
LDTSAPPGAAGSLVTRDGAACQSPKVFRRRGSLPPARIISQVALTEGNKCASVRLRELRRAMLPPYAAFLGEAAPGCRIAPFWQLPFRRRRVFGQRLKKVLQPSQVNPKPVASLQDESRADREGARVA